MSKWTWLIMAAGLAVSSAPGEVVNDGSTTDNLTAISNVNGAGLATDTLTTAQLDAEQVLLAAQSGEGGGFALRSAWYAQNKYLTGAVYTVSADFQPAAVSADRRGGVIGWLDTNTNAMTGIAWFVVPSDPEKSFRLAVVNFLGANAAENESLNHLFNLDGSPATSAAGSSRLDLGNYDPSKPATFQLAFQPATAAEQGVVTNATAHVTATVFQGTDTQGKPIPLGDALELLTDLPVPQPEAHRFGYFAYFANIFFSGDSIGYLDNLQVEGDVGTAINQPPTVALVQPTDGAQLSPGDDLTLEATASDPDGTVAKIEFFEGTQLLGFRTGPPFTFVVTNLAVGDYVYTAKATDNQGAATTSVPVHVKVAESNPGGGEPPPISIARLNGDTELSWTGTGFRLQFTTSLSQATWQDVAGSSTTNRVLLSTIPGITNLTAGDYFFRLQPTGTPVENPPSLTIQSAGNGVVTLSWPDQFTGYQLQATDQLGTVQWTNLTGVTVTNNQATVSVTGAQRFFRLVKP